MQLACQNGLPKHRHARPATLGIHPAPQWSRVPIHAHTGTAATGICSRAWPPGPQANREPLSHLLRGHTEAAGRLSAHCWTSRRCRRQQARPSARNQHWRQDGAGSAAGMTAAESPTASELHPQLAAVVADDPSALLRATSGAGSSSQAGCAPCGLTAVHLAAALGRRRCIVALLDSGERVAEPCAVMARYTKARHAALLCLLANLALQLSHHLHPTPAMPPTHMQAPIPACGLPLPPGRGPTSRATKRTLLATTK